MKRGYAEVRGKKVDPKEADKHKSITCRYKLLMRYTHKGATCYYRLIGKRNINFSIRKMKGKHFGSKIEVGISKNFFIHTHVLYFHDI